MKQSYAVQRAAFRQFALSTMTDAAEVVAGCLDSIFDAQTQTVKIGASEVAQIFRDGHKKILELTSRIQEWPPQKGTTRARSKLLRALEDTAEGLRLMAEGVDKTDSDTVRKAAALLKEASQQFGNLTQDLR